MFNLPEIPKDFHLTVSVDRQSLVITASVLFVVIITAVAVGVKMGK